MKTIVKIVSALLLLIMLFIAVVLFLPDQQYRLIAKMLLETATDRQVEIAELTTSRGRTVTIEARGFSMSNASWAKSRNMASAGKIFISVDLQQLLQGKLRIDDLAAEDLDIDLLKNENGETNWQFKDVQSDKTGNFDEQILTQIILSKINLTNTRLSYTDHQNNLKYRLELPALQLIEDTQHPDLQTISAQGVFNDLPFTINGELGLIDSLAKNKTLPFNIKSKLNESDLQVSGQIDEQPGGLDLITHVTARTRSLADLSVFTVNALPAIGPIDISAEIAGNLKAIHRDGLDINQLQINVDDPTIKLDIDGSLSEIGAGNAGDVTINLEVLELTKLSELAGLKKQLPGKLSLRASAKGRGKDFGLTLSQAILTSDFINARLSGEIADLINARQAEISVEASAPDIGFLTQIFGWKMPPEWGPVDASAVLTGEHGLYALTDIVAKLNGASTLTATGTIDNLLKFNNMQLDVEASLATLNEISAFTPFPLPEIGPMTANGKINWIDGKLTLDDAVANYNGQYGQAEVSGRIGDLIRFDIVHLKAAASLPDLGVGELFFGVELPELNGIRATADLVSPTERDLSAKNFSASYEKNGISISALGSIDSMIKNRAVLDLDIEAGIDSLASVDTLFKTRLPRIGPLTGKAKLSGSKKNIQVNNLDVLVSDSVVHGSVKGDLGKLADIKAIQLDVNLFTPALDSFLDRLNIKTKINKPANLNSQVRYEAGDFNFAKSELDIGGDKIIGNISLLNYLDKSLRPKIKGNVNVLNFNLVEHVEERLKKPQRIRGSKFLSNKPLPYEFIETTDLDMEFNIGRFRGNFFDLTNSTFLVRSNNGVFKLGPFEGKLSGGDAQIQLDINARSQPARTNLNVNIESFNMSQAGYLRETGKIESRGDAFLDFKLNATGRTPASIMASANGVGAIYFDDLLLKRGTLDLFTSDLIKQTLNAVNPFKKREKDTLIRCAATAFRINDGLLTTPYGLAAEASEYSVTGTTKINFKTEDIDLEFKTKVKKMLAINPFEKLTGLVKVVGKLTAPVVTFNPRGILEIGATVGAAFATGGLSYLAQDQFEKLNAKTELCSKALGKAG